MTRVRRRLARDPRPAPPVSEARRREWTEEAIRLHGLELFQDEARQTAWSVAWRRYGAGEGPCPVDPNALAEVVGEWPAKFLYRPLVESWQPPDGLRPYDVFDVWRQPVEQKRQAANRQKETTP